MKKDVIQVALLGLGTVGTGVYKVMRRQKPDRSEGDGRPDGDAEDFGGGESSPSANA